jgi:hypothetical protein
LGTEPWPGLFVLAERGTTMNILKFTDSRGDGIEVHVNIRELDIYNRSALLKEDGHLFMIPILALHDVLAFCRECQTRPTVTPGGRKVYEMGQTFLIGEDYKVIVSYDPNYHWVHIKNEFPDVDHTTFRSQVKYLSLDALEKAIEWGEQCLTEFEAMILRRTEGQNLIN